MNMIFDFFINTSSPRHQGALFVLRIIGMAGSISFWSRFFLSQRAGQAIEAGKIMDRPKIINMIDHGLRTHGRWCVAIEPHQGVKPDQAPA